MTAPRMYNIIATQKKTLQDLRKMEGLTLELCAKNANRFRLFAEAVRQVCNGVTTFCRKCKWEGVIEIKSRKGA